ncbi:MAG TPA: hypothetical protein EYP08_08165 [Pyrodictiaceae archaeon]|nr:hypothetical protein [Pyrodictiaceae archaeon]HIQ10375.1 hypothetical protein [Pyrodictium sp.]HIQ56384.1 hypothetical protein [Pyrodictium sp.]
MVVNKADVLKNVAYCIGVDVDTLVRLEKMGVARIGIANNCYYIVLRKIGVHEATVVLSCKDVCRFIGSCPKPLFCYTASACKEVVVGEKFIVEDLVLGLPIRLTVLNGKLFAFLLDGSFSPYTSYRLTLNSRLVKAVNEFDYVCGVVFGWEEPYTLWIQPGYDKAYGFTMLAAVLNGKYLTTYTLREIGYSDLLPHIVSESINVDDLEKLLHGVLAGARLGIRLVNNRITVIFASKSLIQGFARWHNLLLDCSLLEVARNYYAITYFNTQKNIERERVACELGRLLVHSLLEELQAREGLVVELKIPYDLKDDIVAEFSRRRGFRVKSVATADKGTVVVEIERRYPLFESLQKKWHILPLPF